jgi:hypothetical protein
MYASHADHDCDNYAVQLGREQDRADQVDREEIEVRAEIVEVFTKAIRAISPARLTLPATTDGGRKESSISFDEGMSDLWGEESQTALYEVLRKSDCPHVAKWREAMAGEYADRYARDVADCRVD